MLCDETVTILNELLQITQDGIFGLAKVAEHANSPELIIVFEQRAIDCATAASELRTLLRMLGGIQDEWGDVAGKGLHEQAKAVATVGDADIAVLDEAEYAENRAKAAYAKALAARLPRRVRSIVQRQHDGAVHNHDLIRELRECCSARKEKVSNVRPAREAKAALRAVAQ
jgi:uncharacterized protein (TIGR02284 family)